MRVIFDPEPGACTTGVVGVAEPELIEVEEIPEAWLVSPSVLLTISQKLMWEIRIGLECLTEHEP